MDLSKIDFGAVAAQFKDSKCSEDLGLTDIEATF